MSLAAFDLKGGARSLAIDLNAPRDSSFEAWTREQNEILVESVLEQLGVELDLAATTRDRLREILLYGPPSGWPDP